MRRARLKHLAAMIPLNPPTPGSTQNVRPAPIDPEESRQVRFRRCYDYALRNIQSHVTVVGKKTRQRLAVDPSTTRARIRSLARKEARQAAQYA